MLRGQIKKDIAQVIKKFTVNGSPRFAKASRGEQFRVREDDIGVMRTADAKFGDYSTNVALKVAKDTKVSMGSNVKKTSETSGTFETSGTSITKQSTMGFANILADSLKDLPYVEKLEVASPGFINFFIKPEVWQKEIGGVLESGAKYGSNQLGKGKKARVEFVSANPTGPLHFGNARGGPIGDVLASVLQFSGYQVLREYLHDDIGGQVTKLGESIASIIAGTKLAGLEYQGEYVKELATKVGKVKTSQEAGQKAVEILLEEIIAGCKKMGINFDKVFAESDFIAGGQTKTVLEKLQKGGFLKKKEGATWFAPNDQFLKDRECVVSKSDGSYTYFANDIAYHNLKFSEGYDLVIDVFGANHHGHVPRLQAVIKALGYDVSRFRVILYQWVRFKREGEIVAMSKRAGTFVTAREVLDEVGRDALRFFILMHDSNTHMDFDLELARKKSTDNPVYYVQYAHARIASILAKAKGAKGGSLSEGLGASLNANYELLTTNYELDLIKQITRLPELVEDIASSFAVHRLTSYAAELADSFHRFYENCRVIEEKRDLMQARIGLIMATKITLANTLGLLGISAPEKM